MCTIVSLRRLRSYLVVAGLILATTATLELLAPQRASAFQAWCNSQGGISALGTTYYINNRNCTESDGSGHELALWYVPDSGHEGTLPGCYHAQLTDNGYSMANSPDYCNPHFPFQFWAGWIYHPYWGTYCTIIWVNEGSLGYKQAVPKACGYTNGGQ